MREREEIQEVPRGLSALWPLLLAAVLGCGGGSSSGVPVDVFVAQGTVGAIVVGAVDLFGTTIQGDGTPYDGAAYLIGSCTSVDDGNNVTSRTFEIPQPLEVGESLTWSGTLNTINGSGACLGPDYTWTLSRPAAHTLTSVVDVFNVRQTLLSLSLPSDFTKDPGNRFVYERSGFRRTVDGCSTSAVGDVGLSYDALAQTCDNGAGILVGFGTQAPPSSFVEWRNDRQRVGLRRTILASNYRHVSVFNAPGTDNLQPSWDGGPINPGATLHAEEEWQILAD